jgi:hypothetical protein
MNLNFPRPVRVAMLLTAMIVLAMPSIMSHSASMAASCVVNPVVTNNADSGVGSLRQAILDACDGSTITFANTVVSPITLVSELAIDKDLTIQGPGAAALTISGNNAVRVLNIGSVNPVINVTVSGLTIAFGNAAGSGLASLGGGIFDNITGTLTITDTAISNNNSVDMGSPGLPGVGGGIYSNSTIGSLNVINSTFSGNGGFGGAIFTNRPLNVANSTFSENKCSNTNPGGSAFAGAICNVAAAGQSNVTNSTFLGNTANNASASQDAFGGAIYNATSLDVTNSTFVGNSTNSSGFGGSQGGAIYTGTNGPLIVTNSTFVGNTASSGNGGGSSGGGIFNFDSRLASFRNSIMALNTVTGINITGPDVSGAFTSQGHNLIGKGDGSTGFSNGTNGDQVGTIALPLDPKVGPPQNNGGPTPTVALLPGSPAIDAGDDSVLGSPLFLTTDQRGPGFPRNFGAHVDIGAFELQCSAAPMVTLNPVSQISTGGSVVFTAAASGTPTPTVQWQVSTDGVTFTNIPGATTATLTITPTPSQSGSQYRAVFANPCGTATTSAAVLTILDVCLKDNSTGNLFQWNSTTGQYKFTRCSDGFTLTGTGMVRLVNGIRTLTDFKTDRRISAGFITGQMTGSATILLNVAQGVWQTFRINDTNPAATCSCGG